MIIRRALYFAQFGAALLLPIWIFLARGIVANDTGWDVLAYAILCPVLFVVMIAIAALVTSRKSVRTARAVSWLDVIMQVLLYAALITAGFVTTTAFVIISVLILIAFFWVAIWELVTEARARFRGFVDEINLQSQPIVRLPDDARVIVVKPSDPDQ